MKYLFFIIVSLSISGCGTFGHISSPLNKNFLSEDSSDHIYVVKQSDSLWSIAKKYDISVSDLLSSNRNIQSNTIFPGDRLLIPASSKKVSQNFWKTPFKTDSFKYTADKWIIFYGAEGEPIHAINGGKVITAGSNIPGYGNSILLEHEDKFLSFYGHLMQILVKEGDSVSKGQVIALLGKTEASSPMLRFQLRHRNKLIDPSEINFD